MKRLITLTAIAFLLSVVYVAADPGQRGGGRGLGHPGGGFAGWFDDDDMGRPGMLLRLADEIGLDESQKAQILKMNEEHAILRIDKEAELEKAQVKLRHLRISDAPEKEVLAAIDKVGALKTEMRKMQYQHRQRVSAVLNAEQLKKLQELRPGMGRGDGPGRAGQRDGRGWGSCDGSGPHGHRMNCDFPCRRM